MKSRRVGARETARGLILRNEALRRGAGKPHLVQELVRTGGEAVYVSAKRPGGFTQAQYDRLIQRDATAAHWGWRVMRRNPTVYARGAVSHADHATINLPFWHRVMMNTETQTRNVAFLD